MTALGLLVLGLVNCLILVQKKSKVLLHPCFQPPRSPSLLFWVPRVGGVSSTEHYAIIDSNGSGDCSPLFPRSLEPGAEGTSSNLATGRQCRGYPRGLKFRIPVEEAWGL